MNWLENIYKKYLKVSLFLNTEKIPKSRLHIHAFDLEEIANNSSNSSISLTNQSKSYSFFCYQLVQFSSIEKFFLLKVALLTWFQCYVLKVILKLKSKTDLMFWLFITIYVYYWIFARFYWIYFIRKNVFYAFCIQLISK